MPTNGNLLPSKILDSHLFYALVRRLYSGTVSAVCQFGLLYKLAAYLMANIMPYTYYFKHHIISLLLRNRTNEKNFGRETRRHVKHDTSRRFKQTIVIYRPVG